MADIEVTVDARGPMFDGLAEAAVGAYVYRLASRVSQEGVNRIRAYLPTQYMYLGHNGGTPQANPIPPNAGELAAAIHYERASSEIAQITDDPVTYGAWIEGVSDLNMVIWPHRRNPPPRRFPGYHAFRKISDQLNRDAEDIATKELQPYLTEMNG